MTEGSDTETRTRKKTNKQRRLKTRKDERDHLTTGEEPKFVG